MIGGGEEAGRAFGQHGQRLELSQINQPTGESRLHEELIRRCRQFGSMMTHRIPRVPRPTDCGEPRCSLLDRHADSQ